MRVHVVSRDDVLWCGYRVRGLLVELVLSFHLYLILEIKFWSAGLYGKCLSSLDGLAGSLSPRSRVAALGFLLCWPLLLSRKASAAKLKGLIFFFLPSLSLTLWSHAVWGWLECPGLSYIVRGLAVTMEFSEWLRTQMLPLSGDHVWSPSSTQNKLWSRDWLGYLRLRWFLKYKFSIISCE